MKTAITIILIITIGGVSTAVYFSNSNQSTEVSVLRDVTELHLSQPVANKIIPLYGLDTQNGTAGIFILPISAMSATTKQRKHILALRINGYRMSMTEQKLSNNFILQSLKSLMIHKRILLVN